MSGCQRGSDGPNRVPPGAGPRSPSLDLAQGLDDVAERLGVSTSALVREGVTLRCALAAVLAAAEEGQGSSALLGEMLRHIERWRAPARGRRTIGTLVEGTGPWAWSPVGRPERRRRAQGPRDDGRAIDLVGSSSPHASRPRGVACANGRDTRGTLAAAREAGRARPPAASRWVLSRPRLRPTGDQAERLQAVPGFGARSSGRSTPMSARKCATHLVREGPGEPWRVR